MSAQVAYDYYAQPAYERERVARPDSTVVPGRRRQAAPQPSAHPAVLIAKVVLAALVVFALLGVVRITLSSAAAMTSIESNELSNQIEAARTEGNQLEVAQSTLSNPARIKSQAEAMGMAAPTETVVLDLSGDVVVTDDAGSLSLSGSVAAAAQG